MEETHSLNIPEKIRVLVRVRPLNNDEIFEEKSASTLPEYLDEVIEVFNENTIKLSKHDSKKVFECQFDAVAGPTSSQADVYAIVKKCTLSVLDGTNSTIFAYGQTGSGKTFSMYGPQSTENGRSAMRRDEDMGIIPRVIGDIFEISNNLEILSLSVYCSFVQIYNENLYDMLRDVDMSSPLSLREDTKKGKKSPKNSNKGEIYVQGISEFHVKDVKETLHLLKTAEKNRKIRETALNLFSSRSHSIFQILLEQKRVAPDGGEINLTSKFNLVDLAGSEKWRPTKGKEMSDEHVAEMTNINLSLHTLGRCISALAIRSLEKNVHVPYRDSKLTRLLQDSLGGNARTFLIATISPSRFSVDESISTLKFADRAKQVMVVARVNETRPVDHLLVQRLLKEVDDLKNLLKKYTMKECKTLTDSDCQSSVGGRNSNSNSISINSDGGNRNWNENENGNENENWDKNFDGRFSSMARMMHKSNLDRNLTDPLWNGVQGLENNVIGGDEDLSANVEDILGYGQPDSRFTTGDLGSASLRKEDVTSTSAFVMAIGSNRLNGMDSYREENRALRKEIDVLNARHLHDKIRAESDNKAYIEEEETGNNLLRESERAYQSLLQRESDTWQHVRQMQDVIKKFFNFEVEEDSMRSKIFEIFEELDSTRNQQIIPIPPDPRLQTSTAFHNRKDSRTVDHIGSNFVSCPALPSLGSPSSGISSSRNSISQPLSIFQPNFPSSNQEMKHYKAEKRGGSVSLSNSGTYRLRGVGTSQCLGVVKRVGTGTGAGTAPLSQSLGGRSRVLLDNEVFLNGAMTPDRIDDENEKKMLKELFQSKVLNKFLVQMT